MSNNIDLFNVSDENKKKVYESVKYTGVIPYRVVAINPNHEQLKTLLNYDGVSAPNYVNQKVGDKMYNKLVIYLQSQPCQDTEGNDVPQFIVPMTFNLSTREDVSGSGKYKIINNHGQSMYNVDVQTQVEAVGKKTGTRYFSENGARIAREGEYDVYSFVLNYLNLDVAWKADGKGNSVDFKPYFDKLVTLSTEGIEQFQKIFSTAAGKAGGVKVLTGVRTTDEGKQYYSLFMKKFLNIDATVSQYRQIEREAVVKDADSITYNWGDRNCFQDSTLIKKFDDAYMMKQATQAANTHTPAPEVTASFFG